MSLDGVTRRDLRDRLEWLRLLGVEEVAVRGPARPATAPAVGALPQATTRPTTQPGLFGGDVAASSPPAPRRGRAAASSPASAEPSPLLTARAPEAPDAAAALDIIRRDIGECRRCRLCEKRTNIVFGVGSPLARLMFIGEGPGADEDEKGEPFVGRAGQLLTRIIEAMGLKRQEVYIANVVKCRPPDNRTPLPDEIGTCSPFLFQQVAAIRPRVVVCLGTPAAQAVLGTRETITRLRGAFRELNGMKVMPTFHPAYLLRNPAAKKDVWEDMKKVMDVLRTAQGE